MNHLLEADSILLEFGRHRVLQDVYLKCETGNITGILGRNGAGKTCLMQILFGHLKVSNQSIRLNSQYLDSRRIPTDFMYMPQYNFFPKSLSTERILKDFELNWDELVAEFPEFKGKKTVKLKHFSSGEGRLLEVYCFLKSPTRFCLLDEPFSQIMPLHVDRLKTLMIRQKKKKGILITDHMYRQVLDVCDTLYVLANAKTYFVKNEEDLVLLGYTRPQ